MGGRGQAPRAAGLEGMGRREGGVPHQQGSRKPESVEPPPPSMVEFHVRYKFIYLIDMRPRPDEAKRQTTVHDKKRSKINMIGLQMSQIKIHPPLRAGKPPSYNVTCIWGGGRVSRGVRRGLGEEGRGAGGGWVPRGGQSSSGFSKKSMGGSGLCVKATGGAKSSIPLGGFD